MTTRTRRQIDRWLAAGRPVRAQVQSPLERRAVEQLARDAGCPVATSDDVAALVVTDDIVDGRFQVLVTPSTPVACRAALLAMSVGAVVGVVTTNDPDQLIGVLGALIIGLSPASAEVIDTAAALPALTDRQADVLGRVLRGQTYVEIAADLDMSESTIKRDVQQIEVQLGVRTRGQLAARAEALGYGRQGCQRSSTGLTTPYGADPAASVSWRARGRGRRRAAG